MAGTITANTIQSDNTSPPSFRNSTREIGTLCRAWVNFNGSTATIRASFNVSSITANGTGDFTVNFTNALTDANYSASSIGPSISNGGGIYAVAQNTATNPTSSAFRINVQSTGGTMNDNAYIQLSFFR